MTNMVDHRALVRGDNTFQLRHAASPASEEVGTVRVLRVGVCGTDLQMQRRVRADRAAILGHEGIGLRLGDRDAAARRCEIFNPVDPDDQDAVLGHSYDGLLQDFVACEIFSHRAVAAHGALPLDLGPLVEPTATALYAWELIRPHLRRDASVAIFGGGSAAVLLAMLGEDLGYRIHLIHPRQERLRFLTDLEILRSTELADTARSDSVEAAVVCLPREAASLAIEHATDALVDDGVLDLFGGIPEGLCHPALPQIDLAAIRRANVCGRSPGPTHLNAATSGGKQLRITGHRGSSAGHLHQAQQRLITAAARFGKLVTHVISMEEAVDMIPAMAQRTRPYGEYVKVVVDLVMSQPARTVDLDTCVEDYLREIL